MQKNENCKNLKIINLFYFNNLNLNYKKSLTPHNKIYILLMIGHYLF